MVKNIQSCGFYLFGSQVSVYCTCLDANSKESKNYSALLCTISLKNLISMHVFTDNPKLECLRGVDRIRDR